MFFIKNKITGNYFVADTLVWTPWFEGCRFFETEEKAIQKLYEILPAIGKGICGVYDIRYEKINTYSDMYSMKFVCKVCHNGVWVDADKDKEIS